MALPLSLPAPPVVGVLLVLAVTTLTSGQCPEGKFGAGCRHLCHCVQDSTCDVSSGVCSAGCQEGYSGPWCQRRNAALGARVQSFVYRSLYRGDIYRSVDGNKTTCDLVRGHRDEMLNVTLNSSYVLSNIVLNGSMSSLGLISYVGISTGNGTCARLQMTLEDPEVHTGCDTHTNNFTIHFEGAFYLELCEIEVFVCEAGFHGDECDQLCGHCKNDGCEQKNGTCAEGCETGHTGSRCEDPCIPGRYGHACSRKCGHCVHGGPCDAVSGACPDGCEAGFTGAGCQEKCASGTFGSHCSSQCGQCRQGAECDSITGSCPDGCEAGYAGDGCHQKCSRETYGENCSRACPACDLGATCHHVTGACPQKPDRLGAGVGVGVAVCVGLAALLVAGLYLVRKRGWGLKRTPAPAGQATSASLPPTPWQPGQPDSRNRGDSQADYSSLELSTRRTDSMYQQVGTPYENMAFGGRDENNK